MKRLILFTLLLSGMMASGQSKGYLRYDSTYIQKIGGNNELIIQNGSRSVYGGLLTNVNGQGLTRFIRPRVSFDTLFLGVDTVIVGTSPINIYNANGTLTGDRNVLGDGGAYGLQFADMANFEVYSLGSAGKIGALNVNGSSSSLSFTDPSANNSFVSASSDLAQIGVVAGTTVSAEVDSIKLEHTNSSSTLLTDSKIVARTPDGGIYDVPATAIGGLFGRSDPSNTSGAGFSFSNAGQQFLLNNMASPILEADDSLRIQSAATTRITIGDSIYIRAPEKVEGQRIIHRKGTPSEYYRVQDEFGTDAVQYSWNRVSKIHFMYLYDTLGAFHFQQFNAARTSNWIIGGFRRFLGSCADSALWRLGIYYGAANTDMEYESPSRGGYIYYHNTLRRLRVNTGSGFGNFMNVVSNVKGWALDTAYVVPTGDSIAFEYEYFDGTRVRYAVKLGGGLTNPMTTAGDIIYGGASGTPTRLPIGALGTNVIVDPTGALLYDVKSSGPNTYYYFNDFVNTVGTSVDGNGVMANNSSGTSSVGSPDANNHPGVLGLQTSTGATNAAGVNTGFNSMSLGGGSWEMNIGQRSPSTASDGTDTYQVLIGFFDANTANQTDGVYFLYDSQGVSTGSAASANWQIVTASNSTRTFTTTSSAVGTSTYSTLKITINAAGTLATFYVNGVSVGTSSTNIPTGTSRGLGYGARIIKSAGTNNRQQFIDYIEVKSLFTSAR